MKYSAHYKDKKISFLSEDLTISDNGHFGVKMLNIFGVMTFLEKTI